MKDKKIVRKLKEDLEVLELNIEELEFKKKEMELLPSQFRDLQYNLEMREAVNKVIAYYSPF